MILGLGRVHCGRRVRVVVAAAWGLVCLLGADAAVGQSLLVFQTYRPYLSGESQLNYSRSLFDTRGDVEDGRLALQTRLSGRYGGRGYIWRPWFSNLTGDLGVDVTHRVDNASGDENVQWAGNGSAALNLVPRSHVPFSANLYFDRNSEDSELVRLRMNQRIKSRRRDAPEYDFTYEAERRQRRENLSRRQNLFAHVGGEYGRHSYNGRANILLLDSGSDSSSSQTDSYDVTADHRSNWTRDLAVSEFVSAFDSTTTTEGHQVWSGGTQANVVANWNPVGDWSANFSMNARRGDNEVIDEGEAVETWDEQYAASSAVTYRPLTTLYVNFSVAAALTRLGEGEEHEEYTRTLSATYAPDRVRLGEFDYGWGSSISYAATWSDSETSETGTFDADHGVSRSWGGGRSYWVFDARQDISNTFLGDADADSDVSLGQSVALTWRGDWGSYRDYARVSVSDSRTLFGGGAESQLLDLAFNRQGDLGVFSRWNVDFSYQIFREVEAEGEVSVEHNASSRGVVTLTYDRANIWNIYNLSYRTSLNAQLDYEKSDDKVVRDSRWENSLIYQLGRLSAELSVDIAESDDGAVGTLMFQVRRRWDSR